MENNNTQLLPFDLEKALAGEPVVTRDGRPVKIAGYNDNGITVGHSQLLGWVGYGSTSWDKEGKCWQRPECDLFMACKPKQKHEGYVNVMYDEDFNTHYPGANIWPTEQEAKDCINNKIVATVKIEWEQ